jgi:hypothetical protein
VDHKLHLAVKDTFMDEGSFKFDEAVDLITAVRRMSTHIRVSANLRIRLANIQSHGARPKVAPKLDVRTRWTSLYEMIDRFIDIYPDVRIMILQGEFDDFDPGNLSYFIDGSLQ